MSLMKSYRKELWFEVPQRREIVRGRFLAHVIWMAFDGFAVNRRLGDTRDMNALTDVFVDLLLGESSACPEIEDAAGPSRVAEEAGGAEISR
jgi:hypothetical protein